MLRRPRPTTHGDPDFLKGPGAQASAETWGGGPVPVGVAGLATRKPRLRGPGTSPQPSWGPQWLHTTAWVSRRVLWPPLTLTNGAGGGGEALQAHAWFGSGLCVSLSNGFSSASV